MSDTLQVLKDARRVLQTSGWNRWDMARDRWGNKVKVESPFAVSFCAAGAVDRAGGGRFMDEIRALRVLRKALPRGVRRRFAVPVLFRSFRDVIFYNDHVANSKWEVIAAFDRAIEMLEPPDAGRFFAAVAPTRTLTYEEPRELERV